MKTPKYLWHEDLPAKNSHPPIVTHSLIAMTFKSGRITTGAIHLPNMVKITNIVTIWITEQ